MGKDNERLKLLLVEDGVQEITSCENAVTRYMEEKHRQVEVVSCKDVGDALRKLDSTFDGAIIDLKLANQGNEGTQVIDQIIRSCPRIPMAILTGTPDAIDDNSPYIGVFKKGDLGTTYRDLLELFWKIYDTGLTKIMGGRGIIERTLNTVFLNNLIPQWKKWAEYGQANSGATERALLRYTLNHLFQLLDDDDSKYFPEEMYLHPPKGRDLRTGSIVREKSDGGGGRSFMVMNPACDLVKRPNGAYKTDHILLVEIENSNNALESLSRNKDTSEKEIKQYKEKLSRNTMNFYHHCLPGTDFFDGGFLNFRKLETVQKDRVDQKYHPPEVQISPPFIKDIVARFSTFYARQGQPDITDDGLVNRLFPPPR